MSPASNPVGERRVADALQRLRDQGERVTRARTALVEVLAGGDDHLSADDIADRLGHAEPSAHRATVYRTLESLVRVGIIAHVHLPHGAATYHLIEADRAHLHLLCRVCGEIIDAPADLLDEVRSRLDASTGFRLDPDHVALTGICASCTPSVSD